MQEQQTRETMLKMHTEKRNAESKQPDECRRPKNDQDKVDICTTRKRWSARATNPIIIPKARTMRRERPGKGGRIFDQEKMKQQVKVNAKESK